jgi:hypothetical protein
MPMIEPIPVEVPNLTRPYDVNGGGEVNIVAPVAVAT